MEQAAERNRFQLLEIMWYMSVKDTEATVKRVAWKCLHDSSIVRVWACGLGRERAKERTRERERERERPSHAHAQSQPAARLASRRDAMKIVGEEFRANSRSVQDGLRDFSERVVGATQREGERGGEAAESGEAKE